MTMAQYTFLRSQVSQDFIFFQLSNRNPKLWLEAEDLVLKHVNIKIFKQ